MKLVLNISILIASLSGFTDSRRDLIAGVQNKTWHLFATTPDFRNQTCKNNPAILEDNTYTFFANGTFEFDHGTVTPGCDNTTDCCGDPLSVTGTWEFTNNGKRLRVKLLHEKGKTDDDLNWVLYDATIDQLTDGVLKFSQYNPETKVNYAFEFRKK